jgi:membrane protease YdiL (CAAX protease family)
VQSTVAVPGVTSSRSFFLDSIREVSWTCIGIVCAAQAIAVGLFLWNPSGLLTLAVTWVGCIGLGIFAWARLRPADLGLSLRGLLFSFVYGVIWLAFTEAGWLALAFARGSQAERPVVTGNIGPLADQLLFWALSEEIVMRGFLLAQLYRKLRKLGGSVGLTAVLAVLISQLFFVLMHVPHRIYEHVPMTDLAMNLLLTGAFGVLFCTVYLQTGNLLAALIVHAVSNVPALLPSPLSWRIKNLSLALTALLVAQLYARLIRGNQNLPITPARV